MKFNVNFDGFEYNKAGYEGETNITVKPVSFSVEYTETETLSAYRTINDIAKMFAKTFAAMQLANDVEDFKDELSALFGVDNNNDSDFNIADDFEEIL